MAEVISPRIPLASCCRGANQPPAPRESPAVEQLDIAALQAAADYAEGQRSRALIVTRHGYIVFEKYWQGSNLDTVVESQGLGRVVAALAAGVAIQDRKIGWVDEPLSYFFPQWAHDPRGEITVRNLLQMSSGLGSSASPYGASTIKRYLDLTSAAPPGKRWLEQDADPDLLGYVIESATGQPYLNICHKRYGRASGPRTLRSGSMAGRERTPPIRASLRARAIGFALVSCSCRRGTTRGDEVIVPRWVPELLQPVASNPNYGSYLRLGARTAPGMSPYAADDVFVVEGNGNRMWLVPSLQMAILRTGGEPASGWDEGTHPESHHPGSA